MADKERSLAKHQEGKAIPLPLDTQGNSPKKQRSPPRINHDTRQSEATSHHTDDADPSTLLSFRAAEADACSLASRRLRA